MFLNFLKKFIVKRKLKNELSITSEDFSLSKIKTVGLLIDETYFSEKKQLIEDLKANGIDNQDITLLLYHDKDKKRDLNFISFSLKNIKWSGVIDNKEVENFKNQKFDLLISYYDLEKPQLLLITKQSKAKYKVGFSNIDKRLNHLMIETTAENNTVFITELFKYLKILNKI